MSEFAFLIGYRHVSSWSLRGWLAMRKTGAPFEEVLIRYRLPDQKARLTAMSPTSKVPLLIHERGDETVKVWDLSPSANISPSSSRKEAVAGGSGGASAGALDLGGDAFGFPAATRSPRYGSPWAP